MPRTSAALLSVVVLTIGVLSGERPTHGGMSSAPGYTLEVLPTLGGNSCRANDLNDVGQVCGEARDAANQRRACLWTEGIPLDLGVLPGHLSSSARGVNDYGQVCGESMPTASKRVAFLWTPTSPNGQAGSMVDLGTLGGTQSFAAAVNSEGLVCGWADDASNRHHAVCWTPSAPNSTDLTIHDLGLLPGATSCQAWDINDDGMICGSSSSPSGPALLSWELLAGSFEEAEQWAWQVANHGAPPGAADVIPQAIDSLGAIVGTAARETSESFVSFSFTLFPGSRKYTIALSPAGGNSSLSLLDRHVAGVNVGMVMNGSNSTAVVKTDGGSVKPLPVTNASAVDSVDSAVAVSPTGTIATNVTDTNGQSRAATAVPERLVLTKEAFRDGKPLTEPLVSGDRVTFVITATNTLSYGIPRLVLFDRPLDHFGEAGANELSLEGVTTSRPANKSVSPNLIGADFGALAVGQTVQLTVTAQYTERDGRFNPVVNGAFALTSTLPEEEPNILVGKATASVDSEEVRDATPQVDIQVGPVVRNKAKVVFTNRPPSSLTARPKVTDRDLPGPFYVILDNLQNATLIKASGVTTRLGTLGSPYIKLKAKSLPYGKKLTAALSFQPGATDGPITFSLRLAVGPGAP